MRCRSERWFAQAIYDLFRGCEESGFPLEESHGGGEGKDGA